VAEQQINVMSKKFELSLVASNNTTDNHYQACESIVPACHANLEPQQPTAYVVGLGHFFEEFFRERATECPGCRVKDSSASLGSFFYITRNQAFPWQLKE
jgi:hypothetical protein